ncbi:MAG: hypothetical protein CME68_10205 [Halobacteriovoraceae bacterium]|nr:hypothetical protein [Halobacteriovoraceae bacterium]
MKKKNIIAITISIIVLLAFIILALLSSYSQISHKENEERQSFKVMSSLISDNLTAYFNRVSFSSGVIQNDLFFEKALLEFENHFFAEGFLPNSDQDIYAREYKVLKSKYQKKLDYFYALGVRSLFLATMDGQIIFESDYPIENGPYRNKLLGKNLIYGVLKDEKISEAYSNAKKKKRPEFTKFFINPITKKQEAFLVIPKFAVKQYLKFGVKKDQFIGMIIIKIDTDKIDSLMEPIIKTGLTSKAYIANLQGRIVSKVVSNNFYDTPETLYQKKVSVIGKDSKRDDLIGQNIDPFGRKVILVKNDIDIYGSKYILRIERDHLEIKDKVWSTQKYQLFFGLCILITLMIFIIIIVRNFLENHKVMKDSVDDLEKRVEERTEEIYAQKKNIVSIMEDLEEKNQAHKLLINNLDQGLFSFNEDGVIIEGSTTITEKMFNIELDDKKIWEVLRSNIEEKDYLIKWIKNCFKGFIPFKDLVGLAPKYFEGVSNQLIKLDFKPIYKSKNDLKHIICVATDVSKEADLRSKLKKDEEKSNVVLNCIERPFDFLEIIDDIQEVVEFYQAQSFLINEEEAFRKFHTLKAKTGYFGLTSFTDRIHKIEHYIEKKEEPGFVDEVDEFDKDVYHFMRKNRPLIEVANKISSGSNSLLDPAEVIDFLNMKSLPQETISTFKKRFVLKNFGQKIESVLPYLNGFSKELGKKVDISLGVDEIYVHYEKYKNFIDSLMHLFKNSIDHGIEFPEERISLKKKEIASVDIKVEKNGSCIEIIISDDGKGINVNKIKEVSVKNGHFSEEEINKFTESELFSLIFQQGITSKESESQHSGRGVGMAALKTEVDKLNGKILVSSEIGIGTSFKISIPIFD